MVTIGGVYTDDSGTVRSGAIIRVHNDDNDPPTVLGTATTDANGEWTFDAPAGTTVHCTAEWADAEGNLYKSESAPYLVVESVLPEPVGEPLHWWPMAEGSGTTTADDVGTNDGTINGATWVSETGGWVGNSALSFNGTGDYIDAGTSELAAGELTLCVTIEIAAGAFDSYSRRYIASAGEDTTNLNSPWEAYFISSAGEFRLGSYDGVTHYATYPISNFDTETKYRIVGTYDATDGEWRLYINGAQVSSVGSNVGAAPGEDRRFIGGHNGYDWFFDGVIDDVILYSTSLTDQQITDDYNRQPWV